MTEVVIHHNYHYDTLDPEMMLICDESFFVRVDTKHSPGSFPFGQIKSSWQVTK